MPTLVKASFDPYLNDKFNIVLERKSKNDMKVEVELVEITDLSQGPLDSFSVVFCGSKDEELGQGTYKFEHPIMGKISLFMTPILHNEPNRMYYQAVFSRFAKDSE